MNPGGGGGNGVAAPAVADGDIIWINNNPGIVGNHDGKEIKFNLAPQGEKLIQYNIPDGL